MDNNFFFIELAQNLHIINSNSKYNQDLARNNIEIGITLRKCTSVEEDTCIDESTNKMKND